MTYQESQLLQFWGKQPRQGITYTSNSAQGSPWYNQEFSRGYQDARRQFDSPYQRGYRRALEEIEREEMIRKSFECPSYWL